MRLLSIHASRCCGALLAAILGTAPARARPVPIATTEAIDMAACPAAVAAAERAAGLPPRLLAAIAVVESGRSIGGRVVPWPWTINVGGTGRYFATKAEAVAAVQALQASGVKSIDIGCAQINLMHHPAAFASLEDGFDPALNAAYAARFLTSLFRTSRSWPAAAASYHSQTPDVAAGYQRRVMAVWPGAAAYGAMPAPAAPAAPPIDPDNVYTPEFARQVALDLAFRARRDAALREDARLPTGSAPLRPGSGGDSLAGQARRGPGWARF